MTILSAALAPVNQPMLGGYRCRLYCGGGDIGGFWERFQFPRAQREIELSLYRTTAVKMELLLFHRHKRSGA